MKVSNMKDIWYRLLILLSMAISSTNGADHNSVRLVNVGPRKRSGMVQQFRSSKWKSLCGGVCWTNHNADVTCKELGFEKGTKPDEESEITDEVTTGRYNCKGSEHALKNCSEISQCSQCKYGAQVICLGAVRLNDSDSPGNYRVEVFRQNSKQKWRWGGLCPRCWTPTNTDVVCRQFGFGSSKVKDTSHMHSNSTIWEHVQINCTGTENHLYDCNKTEGQSCEGCASQAVTVQCPKKEPTYHEKCEPEHDCKTGELHCINNRCDCVTGFYWNKEEKSCTKRPSYNQSCTDTTGCFGDLSCQGNTCRCNDETLLFWNGNEMNCTDRGEFNTTCSDRTKCIIGLTCTENHVCRCENETKSYWDSDRTACTDKRSYNQSCDIQEYCQNGLRCTINICQCENESRSFWNANERKCVKRQGFNMPCTNRTMCIHGLICSERHVCRCVNVTSSYWNRDKTKCIKRSGLGENCTLDMNESCEDTLECKENNSLGAVCMYTDGIPPSGQIAEHQGKHIMWLIVGGAAILLIILIVIALCVIKRRRRNTYKRGQENPNQQHKPNQLLYSEAVGNGTHENDDGLLYSIAPGDATAQGSQIEMAETSDYGYGVLGGKRVENDADGMYSHTKQWTNTGEYDMFVRNNRDNEVNDVNDIYDHARGVPQEGDYDEFQKK
ncbi:scavenger receptor cysteine-rich type 1 protein M160-like isoform X2 [Argopecten irradians]|uniref:scavenger receptor cysteine-rich type 1 protein M160-like isoform X2 n=1 Tax=Argopecten irradians TaxID=31199 RepID=UPI003710B1E1